MSTLAEHEVATVLALCALTGVSCSAVLAAHAVLFRVPGYRRYLISLACTPPCVALCYLLLATNLRSSLAGIVGIITVGAGGRILYLVSKARSHNEPSSLPTLATRFPHSVPALIIASIALVIAAGIASITHRSPEKAAASSAGIAVNAISGHMEKSPSIRSPTNGAYIDGGDILRVCNLSTQAPCTFDSPPREMVVHKGDLLFFKALLHDSGWRAVPYAKFFVEAGPRLGIKSPRVGVQLEIAWPLTNDLNTAERPDIEPVVLRSAASHFAPYLHYVPRSTALLGVQNRLIAHLPDGIFGPTGIALTEIGPPKSCFECNQQYVRFIGFKARVDLP
jgi:hypothetical protein